MDWYLAGRILGVICWPLAAATLVYVVAWLLPRSRAAKAAGAARGWVHLAAALAYVVILFATAQHLLRYLDAAS